MAIIILAICMWFNVDGPQGIRNSVSLTGSVRNAGLEEAQAGIKIAGEISITSDMQMTPPLWQKVKKTKELLDESERGE